LAAGCPLGAVSHGQQRVLTLQKNEMSTEPNLIPTHFKQNQSFTRAKTYGKLIIVESTTKQLGKDDNIASFDKGV
jgi:hypothetical protein